MTINRLASLASQASRAFSQGPSKKISIFKLAENFNIYKHRPDFIKGPGGFYPSGPLQPGELIPMENRSFDKFLDDAARLSAPAQAKIHHGGFSGMAHGETYRVIRPSQMRTIGAEKGVDTKSCQKEIDTLLQSPEAGKIDEVMGKPELKGIKFTLKPGPNGKVDQAEINKMFTGGQLRTLVSQCCSMLEETAKNDGKALKEIHVALRTQSFDREQGLQHQDVKGWLIPHDDRDEAPYDYSLFGTIGSNNFPVRNNVYTKEGELIDSAETGSFVALKNEHMLHDAVYFFNPKVDNGTRHFINVSALT